LCFTAPAHTADPQTDLSEAEAVAKRYMTAFFHGDMQTAAGLMHQETLENLKKVYLSELDKAQAEGRVQQFLAEAGVKMDVDTLRSMNAHDLYVTLMGSNQKRAPLAFLQAAQRAVVNIDGSELLSANEASVRLKISIPTNKGVINQIGGLVLEKNGGVWRVKSNVQ